MNKEEHKICEICGHEEVYHDGATGCMVIEFTDEGPKYCECKTFIFRLRSQKERDKEDDPYFGQDLEEDYP